MSEITLIHFNYIISGTSIVSSSLFDAAWLRIQTAFRPATARAHHSHFSTFLAFVIFMDLPVGLSEWSFYLFIWPFMLFSTLYRSYHDGS